MHVQVQEAREVNSKRKIFQTKSPIKKTKEHNNNHSMIRK